MRKRKDSPTVFLFFDTENSGLDRDFSQIYEIAVIATDSAFNLMSSVHLDSANLPWVVPAPGALLITGITPDQLKRTPSTHFEMMEDLDDYLNQQNWPVVFVAYNAPYDQGILSQNRHQTLTDPFVTSAMRDRQSEGNRIFDALTLVKAVHTFAPGVLKLDIKTPTGKPSMALGNVCRQNGINLSEEDAHGAFSDTRALVDLVKKLKHDAPHVFSQMLEMSDRRKVEEFLDNNEVFAYTQAPYGSAHSVIGTRLTDAESSRTESVVWDLSHDPATYASKTNEELVEVMKMRAYDRFKTPLQSLQKHKQPIVMPLDQADSVWPDGLDEATVKARLKWLKDNPDFARRVARAAKMAQPNFTSGTEPEQQIYDFPDYKVRAALEQWKQDFKSAQCWDQRLELTQKFRKQFAKEMDRDPSLKRFMIFAQRLIYANAPEILDPAQKRQIDLAIHRRRINPDENAPYMTIPKARKALEEIEKARAEGDEKWAHVTDYHIRSLKLYYTALEKEFASLAATNANDNKNSGANTPKVPRTPPSKQG